MKKLCKNYAPKLVIHQEDYILVSCHLQNYISRKFPGKWQSKGLWKFWHKVSENLAKCPSSGNKQRAASILEAFIQEMDTYRELPALWALEPCLQSQGHCESQEPVVVAAKGIFKNAGLDYQAKETLSRSKGTNTCKATGTSDRREVGQSVVSDKNIQQQQQA